MGVDTPTAKRKGLAQGALEPGHLPEGCWSRCTGFGPNKPIHLASRAEEVHEWHLLAAPAPFLDDPKDDASWLGVGWGEGGGWRRAKRL